MADLIIDDWGPRLSRVSEPGSWPMSSLYTVITLGQFKHHDRIQIQSVRYGEGWFKVIWRKDPV